VVSSGCFPGFQDQPPDYLEEIAEPDASGNSRHASQLTVYEYSNITIAGHARFRRLCLS